MQNEMFKSEGLTKELHESRKTSELCPPFPLLPLFPTSMLCAHPVR